MLKHIHLPSSTHVMIGLAIGICFAKYKIWLATFILFSTISFAYKKITTINFNLFLVGLSMGFYAYHKQTGEFKLFKEQINHQSFNVTGIVTDYEKTPTNKFKHRLTIQVSMLNNQNLQLQTNKNFYVYTQFFPKAYIGDQILIEKLQFNFLDNDHFEQHLIKNKIAANIFTPILSFKKAACCTNCSATNYATLLIKKYKRNIMRKISSKMNSLTSAMFNSIFLGNKQHNKATQEKISHNFQAWGIIHYLARSGLHLVIISTIWQIICCVFQLNCATSNIIVLLLVYIFYLLSWSGLPFERALTMIVGYRACNIWMLQIHLLHILNISCIVALINNPMAIFFLDFQLSFLLTYGLVLFNELLRINKQSAPKLSIAYKN